MSHHKCMSLCIHIMVVSCFSFCSKPKVVSLILIILGIYVCQVRSLIQYNSYLTPAHRTSFQVPIPTQLLVLLTAIKHMTSIDDHNSKAARRRMVCFLFTGTTLYWLSYVSNPIIYFPTCCFIALQKKLGNIARTVVLILRGYRSARIVPCVLGTIYTTVTKNVKKPIGSSTRPSALQGSRTLWSDLTHDRPHPTQSLYPTPAYPSNKYVMLCS